MLRNILAGFYMNVNCQVHNLLALRVNDGMSARGRASSLFDNVH